MYGSGEAPDSDVDEDGSWNEANSRVTIVLKTGVVDLKMSDPSCKKSQKMKQ